MSANDRFPFVGGGYGPFSAPDEPLAGVPMGGGASYQKVFFVSEKGSDGNSGLGAGFENSLKTVQKALDLVGDEDTIVVQMGSFDEKLTTGQNVGTFSTVTPGNADPGRGRYVKLIGATSTRWPYAAPQLYNVPSTEHTIFFRSPGWRLSGFRLVGDSGSPIIVRSVMAQAGNTADTNWSPGLTIDNCVIYGAVGSTTGLSVQSSVDLRIEDCKFEQFATEANAAAIDEAGGFSFPKVDFLRCHFVNNVANINMSLQTSAIRDCSIGFNKENTMLRGIDLRGSGGGNMINGCYLDGVYKTFGNSGVYEGVSGDTWAGNYASDLTGASVDSATGITWKDPAA